MLLQPRKTTLHALLSWDLPRATIKNLYGVCILGLPLRHVN